MKRLLQMIACLLAVAWVPISSHCSWEELAAGGLFKCAPAEAEKGDCSNDGDSCVTVESGMYKVPDTALEIPLPLSVVVVFELSALTLHLPEQALPDTAAPPELNARWRFVSHTALPPRAPASVS